MDPLAMLVDVCVLYSVYAILAISMELEYGELGLPNFAKAAFFAVGAFSVGGLSARLGTWLLGWSWEGSFRERSWLYATMVTKQVAENPLLGLLILAVVVVVAVAGAALLGVLASYPAIRLREDYLGITLIAFSETVRVIARNDENIVGGTFGAGVVDVFAWAGSFRPYALFAFAWGLMLLTWAVFRELSASRYGRVLRAIRDSELAASILGRDVVKMRITTLVIGSVMAALAGVVYSFYMGAVNPDDFTVGKTFLVVMIVILGGRGNPLGPLVGAGVYIALDKTLSFLKPLLRLPIDVNYFAYVVFGLGLLLLLAKRPEGLLPESPNITLHRLKALRSGQRQIAAGL
ncbi:MAG: branched-chain amino acid ABC transporter permease [Thermofilum sp.]